MTSYLVDAMDDLRYDHASDLDDRFLGWVRIGG
jgi:hypothetical protein